MWLKACDIASVFKVPLTRNATGILYSLLLPFIWFINHKRCCENDSGYSLLSFRGLASTWLRKVRSEGCARQAAIIRMVGAANTWLMVNSCCKWLRMCETNLTANNEWPPISKKFSSILSLSADSANTLAHKVCNSVSRAVCGAIYCPCKEAISGSGRAFLSIFPLGVSGHVSTIAYATGTI